MRSFFLHYLTVSPPLGYLLLFIGMLFEGDALLFVTGFLAYHGYFSVSKAFPVVLLGAILGNVIWYQFGKKLVKSDGKIKKWVSKIASPFDKQFGTHLTRTMFLAKFLYGLHRAIIIRIGMLNVPWKKFISSEILATGVWVVAVGGLAYLAGSSIDLIKHYIRFAETGILLGLFLFWGIRKTIAGIVRNLAEEN